MNTIRQVAHGLELDVLEQLHLRETLECLELSLERENHVLKVPDVSDDRVDPELVDSMQFCDHLIRGSDEVPNVTFNCEKEISVHGSFTPERLGSLGQICGQNGG